LTFFHKYIVQRIAWFLFDSLSESNKKMVFITLHQTLDLIEEILYILCLNYPKK